MHLTRWPSSTRHIVKATAVAIGLLILLGLLGATGRDAMSDWYRTHALVLRQSLISGLLIGGVYSLAALGLTLIFGVLGILNFAHGTLMVLGMYLAYLLFAHLHIDPYLSLVLTIPALFLVGAVIQLVVINRIMTAPAHNQLVLTLGLALLLENLFLAAFGAEPRAIRSSYTSANLFVGDTLISLPRVYAFVIALLLGGLIYIVLTRTDFGKAIRAVAQDREGAALVGINVPSVQMMTFGLGAAAAGAAGTVIMPFFTVTPTTGATFNITAFVVVVLGSMGNVPGAMLGGILIGLVEALSAAFLPGSAKQLGVFVVFILILLFRPSGLLGKGRNA
jgi:branched-chain amino acid transport system permease protein